MPHCRGCVIAYAKLQDPRLPAGQRQGLRAQLLRYCELDTLAMVMVYEALKNWTDAPGDYEWWHWMTCSMFTARPQNHCSPDEYEFIGGETSAS
jgi:hypothetical protein